MKDCQKCKTYKDCPGKAWYHYGEIRFCPYQVMWIIEFSDILGDGSWPPNPDGSGYVDQAIRTGFKDEAYFVKPAVILAEVEYRLKRTGIDGKLLKSEIQSSVDYKSLEDESRSALIYVKGFRRKKMSYKSWLKQRDYRNRYTGDNMPRFNGKQDLSKKQIQERAKRKRSSRR